MINQRTIEQVYERADIVDVVSDYVELRKAGVNYKGLCPFHQDHAPSLIVSPAKNICKCFACGKGGNPVSFVMAMEGCSYPEAVERLARKYNIEVRREGDGETLEQERQRRKRESAMVIYEAVTEFYRQRLLDDDPKAKAALCYVRSRWDCRERDGKADDWDPAGVWTIGTGHTRGVKPGQAITQAQADQLLRGDLREVEAQVNYLGVCETQGQFAALVSFAFNLGIGNLRRSTLLKKIRHRAPTEQVQAEFRRWNKAGGKVLEGLVKRREWEARRWAE